MTPTAKLLDKFCELCGGCAMWRLILVSFAFLGWSFYELSGGSDYRPSANSIQARAVLDNQRPKPRPLRVNVIELSQDGAVAPDTSVTRTITSLHDLGLTVGKRVAVTLASAKAVTIASPEAVPTAQVAAAINVPTVKAAPAVVPQTPELDATAEQVETAHDSLAQSRDIREVAGSKVNMRSGPGINYDRAGQLTRGTEVIVLRDPGKGWIKLKVLETGRIGF
jgi:hypothetical protein